MYVFWIEAPGVGDERPVGHHRHLALGDRAHHRLAGSHGAAQAPAAASEAAASPEDFTL